MNSKFDFGFERSLRTTSEPGITVYWLKETYGYLVEDVVITATQLLYWPMVLIDDQKETEEISLWVTYTRRTFEERMELIKNAPALESTIPRRVKFKFQQSFDLSSKEGKTFAWLIKRYGEKAADVILEAVCLQYSPVALVAIPATVSVSRRRAYCSRLVFEEFMTRSISKTKPSIDLLKFLHATTANHDLRCHGGAKHSAPSVNLRTTEPTVTPETESEEDDDDDDFTPPIYDLDFDN